MTYHLEYHCYQRHFRQPLITSHGIWKVREGIILCITDDLGKKGWGEIAPIPWFGSETLLEAIDLCQQLGEKITEETIHMISDRLPASQFGFESALANLYPSEKVGLTQKSIEEKTQHYSYLLPAGEKVVQAWENILKQYSLPITLKWKIGVDSFETEIEIFKKLIEILPSGVKLRLDANGGLTLSEAQHWLEVADKIGTVEFIEQPLSPQEFETMLKLTQDYKTPLALDESVATLKQLEDCYEKGWTGVFVIKAAIAGSPLRLRQFMSQYSIDAVFSSVFETHIGRQAVLNLARELSNNDRAVGFGVDHWFVEDESS